MDNNLEEANDQKTVANSNSSQIKDYAIKKGSKKAREKITKEATQKVATSVAKKSALAAAAPVLGVVAIVVLVIVLAIGIASFLVTMPGLAIGELKNLAMDFGKGIASYFGADSTKMVDDEEIIKLLNYLDDMGYDLKGYGFLTGYKTEADVDGNSYLDEDVGVTRYKEDEGGKSADSIKKAESEYLFDYMVSDNYIYTVKNFNMATMEGENWYDAIFGVAKAVFARAFDASPFSFLHNFEEEWGKGMIALYREGSGFGSQGDFYQNSFLGDNIEVDYDQKVLKIKRGFTGDTYEYKMDGWLGRYGIPVDFLLSLHLGTMMPDLAVDVGTSFPTEVIILLHPQGAEEVGTEVVSESGESSEITVSTDRYIPYISKVKDHWYRDIYFVNEDNKQFVQTDLDYEDIMRERWTLYETYDDGELNGEYKLYAINSKEKYAKSTSEIRNYDRASNKFTQENGMYLFGGTVGEANELGLDVTKKAISLNYTDTEYEDSEWINTDGIWTAYQLGDNNSIKQKGEALRVETNPTIKQIFLYNRYFRYDGSPDTAEAITELKNKYNIQDGALDLTYDLSNGTDVLKDKKVEIETQDGNKKEYSIEDVSGKVVLNQDSLNAFTMLENTNTLDADYIYRDFKELVVELGYFTKEELAEETPRLLAWPVHDTGSYGYPYRVVDKHENEFGTLIHSKGDIDAAKKKTLSEIVNRDSSDGEYGSIYPEDEKQKNDEEKVSKIINNKIQKVSNNKSTSSMYDNITSTKGKRNSYLASEGTFKGETIIDTATNCWKFICDHASEYSYGGTSIPVNEVRTVDCSGYVSWIIFEHGYEEFRGGQVDTEGFLNTNWNELYGWEEIPIPEGQNPMDQFKPGDIFVKYNGKGAVHHVTFVVDIVDDRIKTFDCGNSSFWNESAANNYEPVDGMWFVDGSPAPGKIIRIEDINEKNVDKYEGYLGNEAVVSPVTGVLLEYGTYDSSAKQKDERTNIDLKEPNEFLDKKKVASESKTVIDKVGYAKILVLDPENYSKLEKSTNNMWKNNSLVKLDGNNGTYIDDKRVSEKGGTKDWELIDKTVYGYKEFAEKYTQTGIAGNIVYIDGFKCEDVDENLESKFSKNRSGIAKEIPSSENGPLSIEDFSVSESELENKDAIRESQYDSEENYKSISKEQTLKLKTEKDIKGKAAPSISINYDGKEVIFIKEGTVLGRTLTDKELLESSDFRNSQHGTYEEKRETRDQDGELIPEIIGNYLRVIFKDKDDSVIENVEDYMKLGDGEPTKAIDFDQFAYYLGCKLEGFYESEDLGDAYKCVDLNDGVGNSCAFGLTGCCADIPSIKAAYPNFKADIDSGQLPKKEAQDVYILALEAAKEAIIEQTGDDIEENYLFALMDLSHASPVTRDQLIKEVYLVKHSFTVQDFEKYAGTCARADCQAGWNYRGHNRGILATEGRFLLYQEGSKGHEVVFDTDTPWTQFCEGGGTYQLTLEESGFWHDSFNPADVWNP